MIQFTNTQAQDSTRCGNWLSINGLYGFILPLYSNSMLYLIRAHVPALELEYYRVTGDREWKQEYRYPEAGIGMFYAWLGNPSELGNCMGAYPFINFHLQRNYKELFFLKIGIGLSYFPVIFNRVINHKNDVIGSHINALICLRLNRHFNVTQRVRIETGIGITHCSNGTFQVPNLGINLITASTGISYNPKPNGKKAVHPVDSSIKNKIENDFIIAAGASDVEPPGGRKYAAYTLSYNLYKVLNFKNKIGAGFDLFDNNANVKRLALDSVYLSNRIQIFQPSIKVCYELSIGRISLPVETGLYLYSKFTGNGYIYDRIGIRYYSKKHFIINLTLLTHFARADFIEWGAGYQL